ncbi:MAG: acetyl-CoA carboxylase carboxyl transferase subunit alpha [Gammaproteobacteria bacterium]|nr:acetyl-CoA carboxylase carboxyl transferase subunit alpha [Gammaproteobacteria bacterium]|tara:strand:- start:34087 stop:35061 length:975 start_codon:yes stop_codon:yes gene_type:complete
MAEYNPNYLDFEQSLLKIEDKINTLSNSTDKNESTLSQISKLKENFESETIKIFKNLSDWQISQLARHPLRPYTLDYIEHLFTDFTELHGDRMYGDDPAIITGIAKIDNLDFMFIGHQKGRDAKEKVHRNFGMPKPEGYRKAHRIMQLAEKFNLPLVTFIDTPGAYPGIDAESRNQSQAIAQNLYTMSNLKVPIISIIIGEGGSGGALAIGIGDKIAMLEYSIYSVISPEGCASILWKDAKKAATAAEALCITSSKLLNFNLIDSIIPEPVGGAHRDYVAMSSALKINLTNMLEEVKLKNINDLILQRKNKIEDYGDYNVDENS